MPAKSRQKRSNRVLRIAQKEEHPLITRVLNSLGITYRLYPSNRAYEIVNRRSWQLFAERKIADLHPLKRERFWNAYKEYKEWRYSSSHIKNNLLRFVNVPVTNKELAIPFNRAMARLTDVLMELKKEGKIENFKFMKQLIG